MKLQLLLKPEQENASLGFWGDLCLLATKAQIFECNRFSIVIITA